MPRRHVLSSSPACPSLGRARSSSLSGARRPCPARCWRRRRGCRRRWGGSRLRRLAVLVAQADHPRRRMTTRWICSQSIIGFLCWMMHYYCTVNTMCDRRDGCVSSCADRLVAAMSTVVIACIINIILHLQCQWLQLVQICSCYNDCSDCRDGWLCSDERTMYLQHLTRSRYMHQQCGVHRPLAWSFLPRDAMHSADYAVARCPSAWNYFLFTPPKVFWTPPKIRPPKGVYKAPNGGVHYASAVQASITMLSTVS